MRTRDELRKLAEQAAEDLFTNGDGKHANGLSMYDAYGTYLGGWAETVVADKLEDLLHQATRPGPRPGPRPAQDRPQA